MSINSEIKSNFLKDFQLNILQGRQLLQRSNHQWASRLFLDLYFQIEKMDWLNSQKKRQLIMVITNSWWIYINSLTSQQNELGRIDLIRYIDAYRRFFSFLSQLDDFELFNSFWMELLKNFMQRMDFSINGITKFINSFCIEVKERENYLKLVELQMLLMYLRKSIFPSDLFNFSLKFLGEILYKLEPSKKGLFLFVFMENIKIKYQIKEKEKEEEPISFVQEINKILANRLPSFLKEDFVNMRKININERNFDTILIDLEELILYLNNIGEFSWIITILNFIFTKINEFKSFDEALKYISKFIDFSLRRNRFKLTYEIYDFLEDIFLKKTDLGYDTSLIELWVEACKSFIEIEEEKYILLSLDRLNNNLKTPQTPTQIFHYFYTSDFIWQFKSKLFILDTSDFWKMLFYRALYEEKDFNLAQKIMPFFDENLQSILTDLNSLYNDAESIKSHIYKFKDQKTNNLEDFKDYILKQGIIRIDRNGKIHYRLISKDDVIVEGIVSSEFWNDTYLIEIYEDIFSGQGQKKFNFNLTEFGKLLYIFLPRIIRNFFNSLKNENINYVPQILFILDKMTIPFGLVYDNNFFMLKYSSSYIIGEPSLSGITFKNILRDDSSSETIRKNFNVLIVEAANTNSPLKWNEEFKNKTLIFPFPDAYDELNYITNYFNTLDKIEQITILSGATSTREKILAHLKNGNFHTIYIIGNIFYSSISPVNSYFVTNDNNLITFTELRRFLEENNNIQPLLFLNTQIFDVNGNKLKNNLKEIGEILRQFKFNNNSGIIARTIPLYNEFTRNIVSNFYTNLFNNESQGLSLLKAKKQCNNGLAINCFIQFGIPWKNI